MTATLPTRRGLMLVLSSPSGAGKSSIGAELLKSDADLVLSVSATTRAPRPGESDGVHYYFVDAREFEDMKVKGEFLESATVFGNSYGTPRDHVEQQLKTGKDVLFDIDWQGTRQIREAARDDLVSVFILPPSMTELERRLRARGQDSEDVVKGRMARAADEISHWTEYDYVIVNRDIDRSIEQVRAILTAERLKRTRQPGLAELVAKL